MQSYLPLSGCKVHTVCLYTDILVADKLFLATIHGQSRLKELECVAPGIATGIIKYKHAVLSAAPDTYQSRPRIS